ncbi:MAG: hypothetical protein DMG05_08790 [Acidobacteria bacterium]|nr:MAG: hypothetical protein DMG05_08790 [Acidobacteriota bacterium]
MELKNERPLQGSSADTCSRGFPFVEETETVETVADQVGLGSPSMNQSVNQMSQLQVNVKSLLKDENNVEESR